MSKKPAKDLLSQRKTGSEKEAILPEGAERDVQESTFRSQTLLDVLPDLIFLLSKDGIILDYHAPDPSLLFAPPQIFLGKTFKKVLPENLAEKLEILFHQGIEAGEVQSLEYSLSLSGKIHHFEARIVRFEQDKLLTIIQDISKRKDLEEVLKENQEKYRHLVENVPTGLYEIDYWNQKLVSVNDIMCQYLGYSKEELLSQNFLVFLPEESKRVFAERLQKIVSKQPVPNVVEFKMNTKQGKAIWVLANARPIYEEGNLKGAFVVAQDITALKSAELALRESEGHLRSLMENARDFAIYRLRLNDKKSGGTSVVFVSPSLDTILGPSDRLRFETWFNNIHPDDLDRIKKAQRAALGTFQFDEEMQIFNPQKKEWRWVRVTWNGLSEEDRRTKYINGIIRDITNKKNAEEVLQKAHDHLEQRIKQRTTQLIKINEKLKKEIKERKEFETALAKSEKKLRLLSNRLINAQEDERKRIAIELHDELGQSLIGLKFQLSNLPTKLQEKSKGLKGEIQQALEAIDLMTENVRRLSKELHPSVLEYLGLFEALRWLFGESSQKFSFKIINRFPKSPLTFSKEQEIIIFRIFQEALTNIGKHAQARLVSVDMMEQGNEIIFSITDDGKGFDLKELSGSPITERGLGLTAMDERARMAGGGFHLWSQKGKGTKITFAVPVKKGRRKAKASGMKKRFPLRER